MRVENRQLFDVIQHGGLNRHYVADLYYGTERRMANVPLSDVSLSWKGDAQIQGSGTVRVVWQGDFADSLVPRRVGDALAPFGATLAIREVFQVGTAKWEVPLGWFPIVDVPSAYDSQGVFQQRAITYGSVVELVLQDRMSEPAADPYDVPTTPRDLASAVNEAARIAGLQIARNPLVPDRPITKTVVYEEDRLGALYDLCKVVLNATPFMNSDGAMSFRPNVWPAPVATLKYGRGGTIQTIDNSMSAEGVKNYFTVRSHGGQETTVLYKTWVTTGPLRVYEPDGSYAPARARKTFLSSQFVTTYSQAQEWAERERTQQSRLAAKNVRIVLGYNPLFEVGDVVKIRNQYDRSEMLCRFTEVALSSADLSGGSMTATVEVAA